jgi:hypothetical protein
MKIFLIISFTLVLSAALSGATNRNKRDGSGNDGGWGAGDGGGRVAGEHDQVLSLDSYPAGELDAAEAEGILLIREEEKLARDVYLALAEMWNVPIFSNIARSEQTHMDSMGQLIQSYGLTDPVITDARGEFSDPVLADLYGTLTARGSASVEAAMEVGARVEELDIYDINRLLEETDNADIKVVYQNLVKGSRNHLRSFFGQLDKYGADFVPEYIAEEEFQKIISTPAESGSVITDPDFVF